MTCLIYNWTSLAKTWKIIAKRFDNHVVDFISGWYKSNATIRAHWTTLWTVTSLMHKWVIRPDCAPWTCYLVGVVFSTVVFPCRDNFATTIPRSRGPPQWSALERLCRRFRGRGGFGWSVQLSLRHEYRWGADNLATECSKKAPDRLYTDKHKMDSLCHWCSSVCVARYFSSFLVFPSS